MSGAARVEPANGTGAAAQVDLALEGRRRRLGGWAALIAVGAALGALVIAARASPPSASPSEQGSTLAEILVDFGGAKDLQAIALALKVVSFLLVVPVAVVLDRAISGRRPDLRSNIPVVIAIVGALAISLSSIAGFLALSSVVDEFLGSGPETTARAEQLVEDSDPLRASSLFEIGSRVVFAVWVALVSFRMMQTGLLSRWLSLLGIGSAVAFGILLPGGEAFMYAWLGSVGLILVGRWPGGVPRAWVTGRAEEPT